MGFVQTINVEQSKVTALKVRTRERVPRQIEQWARGLLQRFGLRSGQDCPRRQRQYCAPTEARREAVARTFRRIDTRGSSCRGLNRLQRGLARGESRCRSIASTLPEVVSGADRRCATRIDPDRNVHSDRIGDSRRVSASRLATTRLLNVTRE